MPSDTPRRRSPVVLALVAVVALVAPLGAAVATGLLHGSVGDGDEVATSADGGAGDGGDRRGLADDGTGGAGEVGANGRRMVGDGPSMGGATPPTTAPPTTVPPTTTAPATTAPPAPTTTAPPPAPPAPPPTTAPPAPPAGATDQVVALVNTARAQAGCGPLRVDARLTAAAQGHSDDMAANDYFDHVSLDGRSFADRVRAAGYPSPGGENIAQGQRSAQAVHDAWMNSSGHRANILNCGFTAIGVGLHQGTWTWTQNFGF